MNLWWLLLVCGVSFFGGVWAGYAGLRERLRRMVRNLEVWDGWRREGREFFDH